MSEMHLSATTRRNLKRLYRFAVEIICIASSVAVFLLAIRSISTRHSAPPRTRITIEDDDIREAVFRWQMARYGTKVEYELTVCGAGPSPALRNRLAYSYNVLDNYFASHHYSYNASELGYFATHSRRRIVRLSCGGFFSMSQDACTVSGGAYSSGRDGSWGNFHLNKVHGRWRVTGYDQKIVS